MRVTEAQINDFALDGGLEADALDFELLHEAFTDAPDHIVENRTAQAVQRFGFRIVPLPGDEDIFAIDFGGGAARQVKVELALGSFDQDLLPFDIDLHLLRDGDGLFSNA